MTSQADRAEVNPKFVARLTGMLSLVLVLLRVSFPFVESKTGFGTCSLLGLFVSLVLFGFGLLAFVQFLFGYGRLLSFAAVVASFCGMWAWADDELGDRYLDYVHAPNGSEYLHAAELIESGQLRPTDGYVKFGSGGPPTVGGTATLTGSPPDARIDFAIRELGSSTLLLIYEPRNLLRERDQDPYWLRRISKKSAHWYMAVFADWD